MARNAEKAMTTLARWRAAQEGGTMVEKKRRPFLASECDDLQQAERWRNQVISEVAKKVAQIQNAGLGEFRIRDLNDEINKLLREKGHWEVRIRELGGTDYSAGGVRLFGADGQEVPGNRGYMYFGAAKDLPGVRELFAQEPAAPPRKTRGELMKNIDADYYGYRDEDDGILIPLEKKVERRAIKRMIKEFKKSKCKDDSNLGEVMQTSNEKALNNEEEPEINSEQESLSEDYETCYSEDIVEESDQRAEVLRYMAHVPNIPTQQQVSEALLERRKKELLKQLLGDNN